jgi:hypothetical protein
MRVIDADALRDRLRNLGYDDWNQGATTTWAEAFNECADMVDETPTIESEPHWIPCSERLPKEEDYRECMECLDGAVWYYTNRKTMGLGYYYDSTKQWSTICDMKPDGKVIAWKPLPEPYKEGD